MQIAEKKLFLFVEVQNLDPAHLSHVVVDHLFTAISDHALLAVARVHSTTKLFEVDQITCASILSVLIL